MIKVTIITPSFNSEKSIERTIQSVTNQGYPELEYIIVDGASGDGTLDIVNKYKHRISKIISEPDDGISDAYNKGINIADGELIGIVAADDELLPNAIQKLVNKYDKQSDVVVGGVIVHDDVGYRLVNSDSDLTKLNYRTSLRHPAAYIRKSAYEKYGYYSLQYKCAMDREIFLRYYRNGAKFQIINEYLSVFRTGGISSKSPWLYSSKEDLEISLSYDFPNFSKLDAYKLYIKQILEYGAIQAVKTTLNTIHLKKVWKFIKKKSRKYLSDDEVSLYLGIDNNESGFSN